MVWIMDHALIKTAFACWESRIAPVFDVARQLMVVEFEGGQIVSETAEVITADLPVQKALRLAGMGIGVLVCGAISRPLRNTVTAYGIEVIPFIAGNLDEIIQAYLEGKLERGDFAMPGCCGRGRRQGQGRMRRGRLGRSDLGVCVCPNCGCREPHERAFPCVEKLCPKCGTSMAICNNQQ